MSRWLAFLRRRFLAAAPFAAPPPLAALPSAPGAFAARTSPIRRETGAHCEGSSSARRMTPKRSRWMSFATRSAAVLETRPSQARASPRPRQLFFAFPKASNRTRRPFRGFGTLSFRSWSSVKHRNRSSMGVFRGASRPRRLGFRDRARAASSAWRASSHFFRSSRFPAAARRCRERLKGIGSSLERPRSSPFVRDL